MAMPGRKPWHPIAARPRRHTTIHILHKSTRHDGCGPSVQEQHATSKPQQPAESWYFLTNPTSDRSNKPLVGETQLPSHSYTNLLSERPSQQLAHARKHTTQSKIYREGGWARHHGVVLQTSGITNQRRALSKILGVHPQRPDLISSLN